MSARPQSAPVHVDDLDLLISRSLDGDLRPEEQRELDRVLASDPAARERHAAFSSIVAALSALPRPEAPFALATRVNAQVDENTRGLSSSLHRFGLFPGKGAIGVAAGALVVLAIGATLLNPPKADAPATAKIATGATTATAAEQDDGRVHVFFQETQKGKPGGAPAAAPPPPAAHAGGSLAAKEKVALSSVPAKGTLALDTAPEVARPAEPSGTGGKGVSAGTLASADRYAPEPELAGGAGPRVGAAGVETAPAPVVAESAFKDERAESEGRRARTAQPAAQAPVEPTRREELAAAKPAAIQSAAAQAAIQAPAAPPSSRPARHDVAGELTLAPGSGWRLAVPARLDGVPRPLRGRYRLSLDADGRVTSVERLAGDPLAPTLEVRLRALRLVRDERDGGAGTVDLELARH